MENKERTLWCGNLSDKVTEDLLYELFLQAGPLENVTIPKDKDGRQRNFGFVTFKHAISVPYAVALMSGVSLFGRQLRLDNRTGADSEPNPYLEKLQQYHNRFSQPGYNQGNRAYGKREPFDDRSRGYNSRRESDRNQFETMNVQQPVTPVLYPGYNNPYFPPVNSPQIYTPVPPYGNAYPGRYNRNHSPWSGNRH